MVQLHELYLLTANNQKLDDSSNVADSDASDGEGGGGEPRVREGGSNLK